MPSARFRIRILATAMLDLIWNYPGDGPPDWEHGSGLSHILVKHPYMRGKLQAMLDRMTKAEPRGERVFLTNDQGRARQHWHGRGLGERTRPGC